MYNSCSLRVEDISLIYFDLCYSKIFKGMFCGDCVSYFVVCMVVGKRRLFCGCGNEVVVFKVKKNGEVKVNEGDSSKVIIDIECWWVVENMVKGFVLNIVVGVLFVWILIWDSLVVECWNFFKVKFIGFVDCLIIFRDVGFIGNLWEI